MYPRLFQLGHVAIPTYGVFVALGLLAALTLAMQRARRFDLDPNKIWNLSLTGIFTALLGSRLLLILLHPRDFLAHPFWILGLVTIRSRGIFYGGLLLAICACLGYIFVSGLPLRRTLDCLTAPVALGLGFHSLGALAAGSGYGIPTSKPWGVVYHHGLATLWSGTPLGVRLHPVQAYEAVILLALFFLLLCWQPPYLQDGDLAGLFLFFYGLALFFLDLYRGERSFIFHGAVTVTQVGAVCLVFAGATLWMSRNHADEGEKADPSLRSG